MLKVNLVPVCNPDPNLPRLSVEWQNPVLVVNGESFDIDAILDNPTGGVATYTDHQVVKSLSRDPGGEYEAKLIYHYGFSAPRATTHPETISVTDNGQVELPPYDHKEVSA